MALLPKVKLKAMLSFPSAILDGAGIDVTRINGAYRFDIAYDDFTPPVAGIADPAHTNALLWNSATDAYVLAPITILGSGGAVPEAPNDGVQYGRQSLSWTPVAAGIGPPGPTGPTGPTGATGPAGATGSTGPAGADGSGAGANYLFSTTTTTTDPGSGNIAFNNATLSVATQLFISETTQPGNLIDAFIAAWDDSTNPIRGTLVFLSATVPSHFVVFNVTGTVTDNGAWDIVGVTWVQGTGGFAAGERVQVFFSRTGDKGSAGAGTGDMLAANNLNDVANKPTSRTNLGIGLTDTPALTQVLLSGTVSSPTNAATKAYVDAAVPAGATAVPLVDATTAVIGVATKYAREDHVHPTDTSRAPLLSPALTGTPTAPTPSANDNSTKVATTAYVDAVGAVKANLASPIFTGDARAVTAAPGDNDTSIATTAFVAAAVAAGTGSGAAPLDALAYNGMQINGSFDVDQPNAGAAYTIAAVNNSGNLMDSWGYSNGTPTTAAYTIQQVASVFSGFNKELKLTVTAAQTSVSSTTFNIIQNIEGFRIARLAPGTASAQFVTVAFWVKSSIAGTMPVYVCNSNITSIVQGNVTITSANVAQYVSTTVQVPTSGTWLTNNGLGMIVLIRPTITTFNIAATVGNTFEITGLVVLPGSLAPTAAQSALITRPYDEELRTCQRYFEWCPFNTFFYAYAASEIMETTVRFSADKRAVPTLSAVAADPSATTLISNMSTTVAQRVSLIGCAVSATATTATTAFAVGYRFSADARL